MRIWKAVENTTECLQIPGADGCFHERLSYLCRVPWGTGWSLRHRSANRLPQVLSRVKGNLRRQPFVAETHVNLVISPRTVLRAFPTGCWSMQPSRSLSLHDTRHKTNVAHWLEISHNEPVQEVSRRPADDITPTMTFRQPLDTSCTF